MQLPQNSDREVGNLMAIKRENPVSYTHLIAVGFIIVDVVSRSIMYGMKREYHLRRM